MKYGFRLPSALDNRPLRFEEYEALPNQRIYISATPAVYEVGKGARHPRGTDHPPDGTSWTRKLKSNPPSIRWMICWKKSACGSKKEERVSCDDTDQAHGGKFNGLLQWPWVSVSAICIPDIHTLERVSIIRDLRLGEFDVLVGVNLLREGLDIPEVSLVAILDAR